MMGSALRGARLLSEGLVAPLSVEDGVREFACVGQRVLEALLAVEDQVQLSLQAGSRRCSLATPPSRGCGLSGL